MTHRKTLSISFCAAVATLYVAGRSQDWIIRHFQDSHSKHDVPEALRRAKALGLLKSPELDQGVCKQHGISADHINAILMGCKLSAGLKKYSTSLRNIDIIYPGGSCNANDFDGRLREFSHNASKALTEIIVDANPKLIGISWGATPWAAIEQISPERFGSKSDDIAVFPVCGFPLQRASSNRVASDNAAHLHFAINGPDQPFAYSIPMVPALIPMGAKPQFLSLFEKYSPGYKEIFGTGPIGMRSGGHVDRADMIITSVSAQNAMGTLFDAEVADWAGLGSYSELRSRVDGDIGGVLLRKRSGIDPLLDQFDEHWTGITRSALEGCARRAASRHMSAAGVCVVAIGANKAAMILKCLLTPHDCPSDDTQQEAGSGLITNLICDEPLATELLKLASAMGIKFASPGDELA